MTLPEKSGKEYLELRDQRGVGVIEGLAPHLAMLAALLTQRGIPCTLAPDGAGQAALLLDPGTDLAAAQEVLDSYKTAKGS